LSSNLFVNWVKDGISGTVVGGNTGVLENTGEGQEGTNVGNGREVVGATGHRGNTVRIDDKLEEGNMSLLVSTDDVNISADTRSNALITVIINSELVLELAVEVSLKMLKGQSVLKNVDVVLFQLNQSGVGDTSS